MTLPAAPLSADLAPARDVAERFVKDGSLPCVVFGVIDGAGHREVVALSGDRQDVREDSVFFIASVTKAIMATALMQYVDERRLELRTPLAHYLPDLAPAVGDSVSAWHLLTHTSGLPDISIERMRNERPTYKRMLEFTLGSEPRWEPGSRYEYNSSAWVLLSELMARLSNTPFPEVLRHRLTGPLGMDDTVFDARGSRARLVSMNGVNASSRVVEELLLWFLARATMPGGGMFGTVPDLLRLGRALLPTQGGDAAETPPRALSSTAVAQMAEPQTDGVPIIDKDGSVSYMEQGLGWRKSGGDWPAGRSVITHGGKPGSRLWIDPERDLAFAFLTNVWDAPSDAAIAVLKEIYRART
jgi:CubicO group peptidase (beta-lactamase class C family)